MMNLHLYENRVNQLSNMDNKTSQCLKKQRQVQNDINKKTAGYKARVEKFIMQMIDQPVNINRFKELRYSFRNEDKTKFLDYSSYKKNHNGYSRLPNQSHVNNNDISRCSREASPKYNIGNLSGRNIKYPKIKLESNMASSLSKKKNNYRSYNDLPSVNELPLLTDRSLDNIHKTKRKSISKIIGKKKSKNTNYQLQDYYLPKNFKKSHLLDENSSPKSKYYFKS